MVVLLKWISSVPQHYQRHMSSLLEGLHGVLCVMHDILIETNISQHTRLYAVLQPLNIWDYPANVNAVGTN